MDREMKRHYTLLVDFLGKILGPDYEVALHELLDDSNEIIAIANGELTGRHLGSPLSNKMLEFLTSRLYETQDYVLRFESTSVTGKKLCSNSLFIKDPHGRLVGLLCINFDSSRYRELSARVMDLCGSLLTPGAPSGTHLIVENDEHTYPSSIAGATASIVSSVIADYPVPVDRLTQDEKMEIMDALNRKGVFLLKGSVSHVARELHSSEASIYRYLGKLNNKDLTERGGGAGCPPPPENFSFAAFPPISGKFFRHCCKYHGYLAAGVVYYRQIEIEKEILTMAIVHANAQTFPQEVLQSSETVLVDFWAAWCGPCKMLAPILEELDGVAPCKIVKVDVDENRALALQYAVASIPTLLVFRNGQLVNRSVGLISREDVLKLVQA